MYFYETQWLTASIWYQQDDDNVPDGNSLPGTDTRIGGIRVVGTTRYSGEINHATPFSILQFL